MDISSDLGILALGLHATVRFHTVSPTTMKFGMFLEDLIMDVSETSKPQI
jgi:hypothetical protein